MRPISVATLILAALLGVGAACWIDAGEKPRRHWPKPTPPPDPSPIYMQSPEHAWTEAEIAQQADQHNGRLEAEIEGALQGRDAQRREAVFTFLLPELVQVDPARVVAMMARQRPGEARDKLRTEVTRQWIAQDPGAAVQWMKTLPEGERRASAAVAVESMFPQSPSDAAAVAEELGFGSLVLRGGKASRD